MMWLINLLAQGIYGATARPYLPRKLGVLNGVVARHPRLLDRREVFDDYEAELIDALETHVQPDDHVVVVGGGLGVTTVVAARRGQRVTVYEAGKHRFEKLRETVEMNGVGGSVDAHHSLVGEAVHVNGDCADEAVSPEELPECDVLEIDAEGSEISILSELEQRPRVIIVECHANRGAPVDDVWPVLDSMGYKVVNQDTECREKGIVILTAVRK